MRACVRACVHACVRACERACVYMYMCLCVHVCIRYIMVRLYWYVCTYVRTLHAYVHARDARKVRLYRDSDVHALPLPPDSQGN